MWMTLEDDFMAVVEEAVKNEPPPPRGHQYEEPDEGEGEEAEAEEEGADDCKREGPAALSALTVYAETILTRIIECRLFRTLCGAPESSSGDR